MALQAYLAATQRLLGTGSAGNLYPVGDLTAYINQARNQIALEGQCVRALPPISGPLSAIAITSGGTGWGPAGVVVSAPDSPSGIGATANGAQALATATSSSGHLTSVTVTTPGAGYFQPLVTFSGAGQGAIAIATVSGINVTVQGQEVYPFAAVNPMVATSGSGIASIFMVNSISLIWGTFRYTLMRKSFSAYQAYVRNYSAGGYQYIPAAFAQFGQGVDGSVYAYPIPSAPYQWEWDCCCLPSALVDDTTPEAIPYPWTECVPYFAAYLALQGKQRFADADRMFREFEKFMVRARGMSQPRGVTNWYGR